MNIQNAQSLLSKYVTGETLLRHSRTVAAVMRYFAEKYGEADPEYWEAVGLLHDLDFEQYPERHCVKVREIFEAEKANYPAAGGGSQITEELIHAVQSHGWGLCCDVEPQLQMERVLFTIDELTGLEIDLLNKQGDKLIPYEIKSSDSLVDEYFKNLDKAAAFLPQLDKTQGGLIYSGNEIPVYKSWRAWNFSQTSELF